MIRKAAVALGALVVLLTSAAAAMYFVNAAPRVPAVQERSHRPHVVKLHARWCVLCLATKDVWDDVQEAYAGRVELIVFDFTNDQTTAEARAEAQRLGLEQFYQDYFGTTGSVFVLDGHSKAVRTEIRGDRNFAEYRSAIDAALREARP